MSLGRIVSPNPLEFKATLKRMQYSFTQLEECGKVVVVAVHGACVGAALELICACDIRLCTKNTLFSLKEVNLGIVADLGGLQRFGKCVGSKGFVRDVCFTGRDFGSEEALKHEFVNSVYESIQSMMDSAFEYCHSLSRKRPDVLLGIK